MSGTVNKPGARSGVIGDQGGIGYEEGTFSISHGSIYGSTGLYTKIGNRVFISGILEIAAKPAGTVFSFSLPFSSVSDSGGMSIGITDRDERIAITIQAGSGTATCVLMDATSDHDYYGFALQYTV